MGAGAAIAVGDAMGAEFEESTGARRAGRIRKAAFKRGAQRARMGAPQPSL